MKTHKVSRQTSRCIYALLCLTGALVTSLYDLPAASSQTKKRYKQDLERVVRDYELLELDPARVLEQVRRTGEVSLNPSEGAFHLVLAPHDMRAENYRAEELLDGRVVRAVERMPVRTYKGTVRSMEGAQARFTIDGEAMEGLIITREQKYFIEPAARYSRSANDRDYVFYKESDVIGRSLGRCGVTAAERVGVGVERLWSGSLQTSSAQSTAVHTEVITPKREVEIATDADFEYFQALGSTTAVINEILSIMNQVEGVYDAEIGLNFKIVFQNVYATSEDPYPDTYDPQTALDHFRDFWNANRVDVARDLAHLWSGKEFDDFIIGQAYIGVVCNNPSESYALSTPVTSAPLKYILTAHEIGHNFSAVHVDTTLGCSSTIMQSNLNNAGNTFCAFSRAQIEAHATANSSCLALSGCVFIISPLGQSFSATGGSGSVSVTAGPECAWTALSNVSWITITTGSSGTGNGTVGFSAAENTTGAARTGTLVIVGQTLTVRQTATANLIDDTEFFVRQHYRDFLGREPDAAGLAYWTDRITQCGSDARCIHERRIGVSAAFFIEQEFQDTGYYVYRFYKASFGRQPNYAEFNSDRSKVIGGSSLEAKKQAFADEWAQRAAFTEGYPNTMSNTEVVNKLFDSAGLTASLYDPQRQQEIQAMNAGRSRALVLRDVIEIPDFKNIPDPNNPRYGELKQISQYNPAFVLMQYFGYLRRNKDQGGYDFWLDIVNNRQPNNYHGMVCSFITSTEYQLRFGSVVTRSNSDCGQ